MARELFLPQDVSIGKWKNGQHIGNGPRQQTRRTFSKRSSQAARQTKKDIKEIKPFIASVKDFQRSYSSQLSQYKESHTIPQMECVQIIDITTVNNGTIRSVYGA